MLSALLALCMPLAEDRLPDVSVLPQYLAQAYVTTNNSELPPGTRALRFPTATLNMGPGNLELRGGEIVGDKQRVLQRVYKSDGTWVDRECGWFVYHLGHGHIHFEDWTMFRLRKILPGGGVGAVVASGAKTSFCVLEIIDWDQTVGGHYTGTSYASCGQIQGLRPGWADVYGSTLEGQFINLTDVPDGQYYLEGIVDPGNLVQESKESNNASLIVVSIGSTPIAQPDAYEPNNTRAEVDAKPERGHDSANFGLVKGRVDVRKLSMTDNDDWFKFKMPNDGSAADYVRAQSPWLRQGNLTMELYNANGVKLNTSANNYNFEQISLSGKPAGTYYVRVTRLGSADNPEYWLTVDLTGSIPVSLATNEPKGDVFYVRQAYETIPVKWDYPATGAPAAKSVSIYKSRTVDVDQGEVVDGYEDMPARGRSANVITVQFGLGDWHVFVRATDGGATTDSFAPARIVVYRKGDTDFDGQVTEREAATFQARLASGTNFPEGWATICDMNEDGKLTQSDANIIWMLAREHKGGKH
ncbi:MAG: hypothetical protein JST30_01115 [Armatimonadetes bacterium]|nr:hypothetical protein [Armatimonadota bacterium]